MDAGDVTDKIVVGFDCAVNVTLKVKISAKGHPKILRISTGSHDVYYQLA